MIKVTGFEDMGLPDKNSENRLKISGQEYLKLC
jgi:hypothetical protein